MKSGYFLVGSKFFGFSIQASNSIPLPISTIVIYIGVPGADMRRGKRTCYEGGLRIPMLVRWPGKIIPQVHNELVSTIDLMPTLLTAAGVEPPSGLRGSALQPLFKPARHLGEHIILPNTTRSQPHRTTFRSELLSAAIRAHRALQVDRKSAARGSLS